MSRFQLRQFQKEQLDLLGHNLDNAAAILNNIEDSDYSYDEIKLEFLRNNLVSITQADPRTIDLVKQLKNFINLLTTVSISVQIVDGKGTSVGQDDEEKLDQKKIYQRYLDYPTGFEVKLTSCLKEHKQEKLFLFVHGKSEPIVSMSKFKYGYPKQKFLWFIEHLLPAYIGLSRTKHEFMAYIDTKNAGNAYFLIEQIALQLDYTDYADIDEENKQGAIDYVNKMLGEKLREGHFILTLFVDNQGLKKDIKSFFETTINDILEAAKNNGSKYSLICVLAFKSSEGVASQRFCNDDIAEEILMPEVVESDLAKWAIAHPLNNIFYIKKPDIITKCQDDPKQFISPCKTIEGLMANITTEIFPNLTFDTFLKNNYPYQNITK